MIEKITVTERTAKNFQDAVGKLNRRRIESSIRSAKPKNPHDHSFQKPSNILEYPYAYQVEEMDGDKTFFITYHYLYQACLQVIQYHCQELMIEVLKNLTEESLDESAIKDIREVLGELITALEAEFKEDADSLLFRVELAQIAYCFTSTQSHINSPESQG